MRCFTTIGIIALLSLAGCASDDLGEGSSRLFATEDCTLRGTGALAAGDAFGGEVVGTAVDGATGNWSHTSDSSIVLEPWWIMCRINGVFVADVGGSAVVNGVRGYGFRMFVQDYDYVSADAPIVETTETGENTGTTAIQSVSASRSYDPSGWEDGSIDTGEHAVVVIPSELPVTAGRAGDYWALVRFERTDYSDVVTCRYRGAGDSYEFVRCNGEFEGTPEVTANDYVDVTWMTLHVQNGDRRAGATTVSVDFNVTTFGEPEPEPEPTPSTHDYYRLSVFEDATRVFHREGELVSGDLELLQN